MPKFLRRIRIFRNSKLMLLVSVITLFFSHAGLVMGGELSITGSDTLSYPFSRIPQPISPMGTVITEFTSYTVATFPTVTGIFYVSQSSDYTANLQSTIANGLYISHGNFVPSDTSDPSTPLSDVMMFIQNGNNSTLSDVGLEAGTLYSYILVFNGSASASFEFMLTGLGEIHIPGSDEVKFITHLPSAIRNVLNTSIHFISQRQDLRRGLASDDDFLGNGSLWMKPFSSWADQGSRNGLAGYSSKTNGVAMGIERDLDSSLNVGGAFVYAKSDIDSDDQLAKQGMDVELYQGIAYGSYETGDRYFIDLQIGVGRHKNKGHRQVAFLPLTHLTAASDYDGSSYHFGTAVGRIVPLWSHTRFVPSIRAGYIWIKNDDYRETGADFANLSVENNRAEALIIGVDGKLIHPLNDRITLLGSLGVGYDTLRKRNSVNAAFEGSPDAPFETRGIRPEPWVGSAGAGVVYKMKDSLEVHARYDVDYRESFINQTPSMNIRWTF
jgi:outer membrane autotransporter protein